jgi:acetyl esterase/lipase
MGAPEMKDVENRLFASELRCAIYSVDHRLAPEAPHPAPVEDIYSVFVWLHANAGQLGLDPARIGIKGESGGGGFAAGAALYARDRQGPKFAFQHLIYPMIDDRTAVRKDLHPYVGEFVWTQENNYFGWRSLLARSRVRPMSRLMRRPRERRMCRACRQPTFRSAVSISSSKKT